MEADRIALIGVLSLVAMALMGFAGTYVSAQKNRPAVEGFIFAALLGPLGMLIVACLPTLMPDPAADEEPEDPEVNVSDLAERLRAAPPSLSREELDQWAKRTLREYPSERYTDAVRIPAQPRKPKS